MKGRQLSEGKGGTPKWKNHMGGLEKSKISLREQIAKKAASKNNFSHRMLYIVSQISLIIQTHFHFFGILWVHKE